MWFCRTARVKAGCLFLVLLLVFVSAAMPVVAKTGEKEESSVTMEEAFLSIHKNTYLNLAGRITERGYSDTSVTGTYSGMFPRDSSIDSLAMLEFGDLAHAQKLLHYLLTYNQWYGCGFMAHILDNLQDEAYGNDYLSDPAHYAGATAFYAQTTVNRDLYLLNAPNNKAIQPFVVPFSSISGVRLNLTKTYDTDQVTVRILTDYRDASTVVATANYTFGGNPGGWQTVVWEQPVQILPNYLYYLEVSSENSGKVVWRGISGSGEFQSINYDLTADGGWRTGTGDITAFEILSPEGAAGNTCVYAADTADRYLYLLNAPIHKAMQPFTVPFSQIDAVNVYLTCTEDTDRVLVQIRKDIADDTTVLTQQEFVIGSSKDGWQHLVFDQPVEVCANERYYLALSAPEDCGQVIWKGGDATDGYQAINFDSEAYDNGYVTDNKTTAFEILPYFSLNQQPVAQQFYFTVSGDLTGVQVSLRTAGTGGTLHGELRRAPDGPVLATAETVLNLAGENTYLLSFNQAVTIPADQICYLTLQVTDTAEETVLLTCQGGQVYGNSYIRQAGIWQSVPMTFAITPLQRMVGLAQIGGATFAEQEIPSYQGETVTAVTVRIGKTQAASGTVQATLLKKVEDTLLYVDACTLPLDTVGQDTELTFYFGLPIDKRANEAGNYVLRLSAESAPKSSVIWYGTPSSDRFSSAYEDGQRREISGDLSFTAYRSYLTPTCDAARQVDCTYMVAYAWVQFYRAAVDHATYSQWLKDTYPLVRDLCNYYLQVDNQLSDSLNLLHNPHFEHTRNTQYHQGYDLITNVFASQSLHEMCQIAAEMGDETNAAYWAQVDARLVQGIQETLVCQFDGSTIYAEMLGKMVDENCDDYFIPGFSWVNLAPIAADWYAADTEILQNTLEKYQKFGSVDYGDYAMLDACVFLNEEGTGLDLTKGVNGTSAHVIGKGWSWLLMFAAEQGNTGMVEQLLGFSLAYQADSNLYTENWTQRQPGVISYSDPGNQEHASWQLYAMCRLFPALTMQSPPDTASLKSLMIRAEQAQPEKDSTEAGQRLASALETAKETLEDPVLLQAQVDLAAARLLAALADCQPGVVGDLNGDGSLTVTDVVLLRKAILNGSYDAMGDGNADGSLTVTDVVLLRKAILNTGS